MALNIIIPPEVLARLLVNFFFIWQESSLPYLGVHLSSFLLQLYHSHFPTMYKGLEEEFTKQVVFHLPWLGQLKMLKITILAKLLDLFRSLLIAICCSNLMQL